MSGKTYPKPEHIIKRENAVLQPGRKRDKVIEVPREKPCNIIIVHGVNDVGTSYNAVEEGLCTGLQDRLLREFKPGTYRMPAEKDKEKVLDDPDLVFFKRDKESDADSPVIPFYWGFRELKDASKTINGQKTDRNGNRLDKDLSKGGGPFGNATNTLPDMWNRGVYAPVDPAGDPLRPVKTGPGRMYMVLAARRLAALVSMIRQYEANDVVNIVAHSQGCLVSLLAQAFLMEMGERTADTLILTHPPYSLDEGMGVAMRTATFFTGDSDKAMDGFYDLIASRQNVHARLQTLVNIVAGVEKSKATSPVFGKISETDSCGMVHGRWKADADRDNRGKVYLYFSPEDMTVALDNMRGIGWQGVPDAVAYMRYAPSDTVKGLNQIAIFGSIPTTVVTNRKAIDELGPTFRQRVFTAKLRPLAGLGKAVPVLVGQPPHDFVLRVAGEYDHAHVAASGRMLRESLPEVNAGHPLQRHGIRTINGESLKKPCQADVQGSQINADKIPSHSMLAHVKRDQRGPCEEVDPIDAAIAVTSKRGLLVKTITLPASVVASIKRGGTDIVSDDDLQRLTVAYNKAELSDSAVPDDMSRIVSATRYEDAIFAKVEESANAARLRWQKEFSPKSFHSAIFGSSKNHRQVTAYDLSIGSGKAVSDPSFYAYLCAVADWRLKTADTKDNPRPGILIWEVFIKRFNGYYTSEPDWRKQLIRGNAEYYSSGVLPKNLPLLAGGLWDIVISETTSGKQVMASATKGKS